MLKTQLIKKSLKLAHQKGRLSTNKFLEYCNEELVLEVDKAVQESLTDNWLNHPMKLHKVEIAIKKILKYKKNNS